MESYVFIPANLEKAKIITTSIFGGNVIAIEGNYDDVNRLCAELASEEPTWAFVNVNVRAYYSEGSKTLAYEVAEQLGWRAPDHVVVPVASGSQLTKIYKGFGELYRVGLLDREPHVRVSGAQAAGWSRRTIRSAAAPEQPEPESSRKLRQPNPLQREPHVRPQRAGDPGVPGRGRARAERMRRAGDLQNPECHRRNLGVGTANGSAMR